MNDIYMDIYIYIWIYYDLILIHTFFSEKSLSSFEIPK